MKKGRKLNEKTEADNNEIGFSAQELIDDFLKINDVNSEENDVFDEESFNLYNVHG